MRPEPDIYKEFPDPGAIDREKAKELLLSEVPAIAPDTEVVYSCTGYLLLALVLERITGVRLCELFYSVVAGPCGIPDLLFDPGPRLQHRVAATEYCLWRKRWIRGEVHDENAFSMGGDGGNAGLFGTAESVLSLLSTFDSEGVVNGIQLLKPSFCKLMHTCLTPQLGSRRAIGFRMQDDDALMGREFGMSSFGHTGFTGTSVWIEPEKSLKIVTLTNRVHLGREETAEKIRAFRKTLHSTIREDWG